MSQNLHDNLDGDHQTSSVSEGDILAALVVHVLVIGSLILFALYQPHEEKKKLKRIEVSMITAQELAKMQRHPQKPKPVKVRKAKPKKPKPAPEKPKVSKPKVVQPKVEKLKPAPKPTQKKAPPQANKATKSDVEDDYDPFAPMVSAKSTHKRHTAQRIDKVKLVGRQLSAKELERYIAMMQAAVQREWKVPGGLVDRGVRDPMVRVELERDGSIKRIRIIESSGQASLDQTLISAIRAAAPFTLPRQQYEVFKSNDIRFHPKKRGE